MSTDRIGDPVIDDERVARAERTVRKMIPGIPEDAQFATYVQERGPANYKGRELDEIPEVACFLIVSKNPRHPGYKLVDKAGCWLSVWKKRDKEYGHRVGETDPAVSIFAILARKHADTIANLKAML